MTRTSNAKMAILAYQKTSDCRNGVSKEALMDYPKATKKLANPKRKNKVCKDVVREIITDEDYQELVERCHKLQEQLAEANAIIEYMRPFIQASMSRQTFTRILNYEDKWGKK